MPAAIASGSSGSNRTAASPHTSGSEPAAAAATGQPHAIASTGGRPNPSYRLGKTRQAARRYRSTSSAPETERASTPSGSAREVVADAREQEAELRSATADQRERLEQARVVLVRPRTGGVEEQRLALDVRRGREARVVDAQPHGVDVRRIEPEPLDDPLADELADHDHLGRPARGAVVGELPEQPLAAREELGEVQVLDVEQA